jgi:hypothetical protein
VCWRTSWDTPWSCIPRPASSAPWASPRRPNLRSPARKAR